MDFLFLSRLATEIVPQIRGRRARAVRAWGPRGLSVRLSGSWRGAPPPRPMGSGLSGKPSADLVLSFYDEAPGLYVGSPPVTAEPAMEIGPRFKKLLVGAALVSCEQPPGDRVLRFRWRRRKPSGATEEVDLVVEWAGSRRAAFLVDPVTNVVLDVFSIGRPRCAPGEPFEALPVPRQPSSLPPLLLEEVAWLQEAEHLSEPEARDAVARRLRDSAGPVLLRAPTSAKARLSALRLESKAGWTQECFSSYNEAARALISGVVETLEGRERERLGAALAGALKKERQRKERLRRDLEGLEDAAGLRRKGELLLASLKEARPVEGGVEVPNAYSAEPQSVRIELDPRFDLVRNAERFFRRARKAERSREEMGARGAAVEARIDEIETLEVALQSATTREEIEALGREIREVLSPPRRGEKRNESRPLGPLRFRSTGGSVILVGRSARSNEELTFRIAHPEDMWFHAKETPGAHVVLRIDSREAPDNRDLEEAAAAAAFYSKARGATQVEVIATPRRNVSRIPGAPAGTVRVSEFRSIRVRPAEPIRLEK